MAVATSGRAAGLAAMFDARLRPLIDPPLNRAGRVLARWGIGANSVTVAGMLIGVGAGWGIAVGHFTAALILIALSRLCDGLDGAIARATSKTAFGGYLDIVCDFAFYVAVPLGFGLADPANTAAAMCLIAAFTLTGISFLAFAAIAAERGLETSAHGQKSFFYSTGIAEGAETIAVFAAMCLIPAWFAQIAFGYAALCLFTVAQRSWLAWRVFGSP
ncbi:MAG: CDP-alcohol phosphatidyltransferase family protein [Sphingopyxis sp.]